MFPERNDPSIHGRRRWFYALWSTLLALAVGALVLWNIPARIEHAKVRLTMVVKDSPVGASLRVWSGTISQLHATPAPALFEGSSDIAFPGRVLLPDFSVEIAHRRWLKATIPARTTEAIVLQFTAPGQVPRYYFYDLRIDIESGILADSRVVSLSSSLAWDRLNPDAKALSRVP